MTWAEGPGRRFPEVCLLNFFIYLFCGVCECVSVFVYVPEPHQVGRGQKTSYKTQFSSKIRVLEIKLYRNQVRTSLDSASQFFCLFVLLVDVVVWEGRLSLCSP